MRWVNPLVIINPSNVMQRQIYLKPEHTYIFASRSYLMAERKNWQISRNVIFISIAIFIALGTLIYPKITENCPKYECSSDKIQYSGSLYSFSGEFRSAVLKLPAVNTNNTGVSAYLAVGARKGGGSIFMDMNNVLTKEDTQHSARIAAEFAKKHENISSNSIDLYYSISAFAPVIEGPSAGGAFAVATIAALRNETPATDVMMTGMINHDGTIGPSGKIIEKARAAKEAGAKVFLVPVGSIASLSANYTESEYCSIWGTNEYCQPEFTPKIIDVSKEAEIPIIEIKTVDEALKYFGV